MHNSPSGIQKSMSYQHSEMSKFRVKVLDCTLRDGGYYNNWDFPKELIQDYILALEAAGVNCIELGFRFTPQKHFLGGCAYTTDSFVTGFRFENKTQVGIMINATDFLEGGNILYPILEKIFPVSASHSRINLVRVACHFSEFQSSLPLAIFLKNLGYRVGFNLMQIGEKSIAEIRLAVRAARDYPIDVLYVADSLGNLTPERTKAIIGAVKQEWPGEIGIHTHDNMGNAIANSLAAIEEGVSWVDATVTGMGRGAGNAKTEMLLLALGTLREGNHNVIDVLKLIRKWFNPLQQKFGWGTNPYYYLAGKYGIHPSYIQVMLQDNRYSEEDFLAVIEYLKAIDSKSFSLKHLEIGKNFYDQDSNGSWSPKSHFENKEVLILGSGPGVERHKDALLSFIEKRAPVVLALNAQTQLPDAFIRYRIACHPFRLLSDLKYYKAFNQPIIMPKNALFQYLSEDMKDKKVLDFGLAYNPNLFEFKETHCIVPKVLVLGYALAVANSGKAKRIYLAGFDGYEPGDVRQDESEKLFKHYLSLPNRVPIESILNTTYSIPSCSVYSML